MSAATKTPLEESALLREIDEALPLSPQEAVMRKLVEDVKARKELHDGIRKEVTRPPKTAVGEQIKQLRGKKGRRSRDLKLLRHSEASPAAIKRLEDEIKEIQDKLDFWPTKKSDRRRKKSPGSPYWVDEQWLLFARHGLTKKAGPGNRDYFFQYVKERGRAAVAELVRIGVAKQLHAQRMVARRLEPLVPQREQGKFTWRSLRPAVKKRATN